MIPSRLVLDTNVLLSALVFQSGAVIWLRAAWQAGSVRPLVSHDTATELLRVLAYPKFDLSADEREDLLADYLPWCEIVEIPALPPAVPRCRDPFDRPFLELAMIGWADALVTGDRDLLALKAEFPVPIITVAALKGSLG